MNLLWCYYITPFWPIWVFLASLFWPSIKSCGPCEMKLILKVQKESNSTWDYTYTLNSVISTPINCHSQNPRERMFVVQISLLVFTFLSLVSRIFVINVNHQRSHPTPSHCAVCHCVECQLLILILLSLVECWCMHMPHCLGRPSGVNYTNGGERRMNSNPILSHATLILRYHAPMLTLHDSVISRALWLSQVWYYGV